MLALAHNTKVSPTRPPLRPSGVVSFCLRSFAKYASQNREDEGDRCWLIGDGTFIHTSSANRSYLNMSAAFLRLNGTDRGEGTVSLGRRWHCEAACPGV
jgi:hypothetical protein